LHELRTHSYVWLDIFDAHTVQPNKFSKHIKNCLIIPLLVLKTIQTPREKGGGRIYTFISCHAQLENGQPQ